MKQGRIHNYLCRGRLDRGHNELGRGSNNFGRGSNVLGRGMLKYKLSSPKMPKNAKKAKFDRTDRPIDRHGDL